MSYTSLAFLAFVAVLLLIYYLLPKKGQWIALLVGSYIFYCSISFRYVFFILTTTIASYGAARWIASRSQKTKARIQENKGVWTGEEKNTFKKTEKAKNRSIMVCCLLLNFGILCFLKYYNFLAGSVGSLLELVGLAAQPPILKLFLPLGISFYTFQSMGYVVDVHRGKVEAETNLAKFALFVSFFPQIVQGPIAFYDKLAHQFFEEHTWSLERFKLGGQLVLWGLLKKLVIADRLAPLIAEVTADYTKFSGNQILLAILAYSLQLYADFSGGIDISRGVAQMFDIHMAENFRQPYFSKNLSEYWRRWHITLGAWLKEYLFYPIAMSKAFTRMSKFLKKKIGPQFGKIFPTALASLITFVVVGVWHGANWKFIAFGFWNGIIIMLSTLLEPAFLRLKKACHIKDQNPIFVLFQIARTYLLVVIGLVFDIAPDFVGALKMMARAVLDLQIAPSAIASTINDLPLSMADYVIVLLGMLLMLAVSILRERTNNDLRNHIRTKHIALQWILWISAILVIVLFGAYGPGTNVNEFVYMQF